MFGQSQPAQTNTQNQNTGFSFGQSQQQQGNTLGASIQQQQPQQMPALSQSQAQLSNSLWQPGMETPRMSFLRVALLYRNANIMQTRSRFLSR